MLISGSELSAVNGRLYPTQKPVDILCRNKCTIGLFVGG